MKWFSSDMLGMLAANNLVFGLALDKICQTFHQHSARATWHVKNQTHKTFSTL
jgi:HD-like signal output (HDOD) protein